MGPISLCSASGISVGASATVAGGSAGCHRVAGGSVGFHRVAAHTCSTRARSLACERISTGNVNRLSLEPVWLVSNTYAEAIAKEACVCDPLR